MRANRPAFVCGGFYHIYNRGAHRESIFREEDNYLFVLHKVKRYAKEFDLTPIAYCLMPNHYHLLVRQDGGQAAGLLPQRVFNSYTKAYNKRYEHSGTLFEGPYKALQIERDDHLLHLCRYIHSNPVKHGLVRQPEEWPYTNDPEWVGLRLGELVDHAFVEAHFPSPAGYQAFVRDYLVERKPLKDVTNHLSTWGGK
jgi:putative transposase